MIEEKITELLANVADGRRYWIRAPQKAPRPYLTLHRVDGVPNYQFCGRGTTESRIQINCIANTYGEAKALARQIVSTLDMYSDPVNGLYAIFSNSDGRDLDESIPGVNEKDATDQVFGVATDFTIHHYD